MNDAAERLGARMGIAPGDPAMANLREMMQDGEDTEMSISGQCPRCHNAGGQEVDGVWFTCAWCRGDGETPGFR